MKAPGGNIPGDGTVINSHTLPMPNWQRFRQLGRRRMALQRARWGFISHKSSSSTDRPAHHPTLTPRVPQHTPTRLYPSSGFMNSFLLSGTPWTGWRESILTQIRVLLIGQRALPGGRTWALSPLGQRKKLNPDLLYAEISSHGSPACPMSWISQGCCGFGCPASC